MATPVGRARRLRELVGLTALTRLAFLGSPPVAASSLRALHAAGHEIAVVVTGPDRRRGRRAEPTPSAVKSEALALGLPTSEDVTAVTGLDLDLGIVVAYGKLVPASVLAELPMLNVHFSLLPRWRGAAPVERAILAGDERTGVCIMALEPSLDTGPIYASRAVDIGPEERAEELRTRLGDLGTTLLLGVLARWPGSLSAPASQEGDATYAAKITAAELQISWSATSEMCHRLIRVGRAWTTFRGQRLVVRSAHVVPAGEAVQGSGASPGTIVSGSVVTGDGLLELVDVQREGRAVQPFASFALGARIAPGEQLGT